MPIDGKDFPLMGAMSQISQLQNLQNRVEKASEIERDVKGGRTSGARDIDKAATEFEALLLQEMLKSMWKNVPSEGLISGSREEELYRDMLNEAMAKNISENQSIGIKEVILREMKNDEKP